MTHEEKMAYFDALPGNAPAYALSTVTPATEAPFAGKHLLFLGSSVALGYASREVSMADYLARATGCKITKEAVSGTTLADLRDDSYVARLLRLDSSVPYDAVICQLSTNDATKNLPLGEIREGDEAFDRTTVLGAMEFILAYVRDTWHCPVIFYTGTRYPSTEYEAMVAGLYLLHKKWGFEIIDQWHDDRLNDITDDQRALYMADWIHPTQAGYLHWWLPKFKKDLSEYLA